MVGAHVLVPHSGGEPLDGVAKGVLCHHGAGGGMSISVPTAMIRVLNGSCHPSRWGWRCSITGRAGRRGPMVPVRMQQEQLAVVTWVYCGSRREQGTVCFIQEEN